MKKKVNKRINEALYSDKRPEFMEHKAIISKDLDKINTGFKKLINDVEDYNVKSDLQGLYITISNTVRDLWNALRMVAKMHDGSNGAVSEAFDRRDLINQQRDEIKSLLDEREEYSLVSDDDIIEDGYYEYIDDSVDTSDFVNVDILIDDRTDSWVRGRVFSIKRTDARYTGGAFLRYIGEDDEEVHDCCLFDVSERYYDRLIDLMETVIRLGL